MKLNGFDSCHRPFRFCNYTTTLLSTRPPAGYCCHYPQVKQGVLKEANTTLISASYTVEIFQIITDRSYSYLLFPILTYLALYLINQYSQDLLLMQQIP